MTLRSGENLTFIRIAMIKYCIAIKLPTRYRPEKIHCVFLLNKNRTGSMVLVGDIRILFQCIFIKFCEYEWMAKNKWQREKGYANEFCN